MKQITLEYFGFTGTGATLKDAKIDAGRKIDALHVGTWEPAILEWRGVAALVYRDLNGWSYRFIQTPDESTPHMPIGSSSCGDDRRDALQWAQRHVADYAWTATDPVEDWPEWLRETDRAEIRERRYWQIAYKALKAEGKTDNEAHQEAFSRARTVQA